MLVLFLINRDKKELLVSFWQKIYLEVLFYKTSCTCKYIQPIPPHFFSRWPITPHFLEIDISYTLMSGLYFSRWPIARHFQRNWHVIHTYVRIVFPKLIFSSSYFTTYGWLITLSWIFIWYFQYLLISCW